MYTSSIQSYKVNILIPTGRNKGLARKVWTKANIKSCSSMSVIWAPEPWVSSLSYVLFPDTLPLRICIVVKSVSCGYCLLVCSLTSLATAPSAVSLNRIRAGFVFSGLKVCSEFVSSALYGCTPVLKAAFLSSRCKSELSPSWCQPP